VLRLVCFARLDCTLSKSHDSVLFAAELIFNLPAICIESTNLVRHRYASIAARPLVRIGNATANGGVGVSSASTGRALHSATGAYEIPMSRPILSHVAVPAMRGFQAWTSGKVQAVSSQWAHSPLNEIGLITDTTVYETGH